MSWMIVLLTLLSIHAVSSRPAAAGAIFVNPGDPKTTAGHPARAWTDAEKAIVNEALSEWKTFIENFDQVFGTWTLRWEDTDFFRDFRVPGGGDDYSGVPGVTVRPGSFAGFPTPPRNSPDFPEGEIYFNAGIPWFFDPTPATDEPGELPNNKIDFLTVAKHEIGHAIGIVGHLPDGFGGAMELKVSEGERDRVSPEDVIFYRQQVKAPEPSTAVLVPAGLLTFGALAWAAQRRSSSPDGVSR